MKINGMKMHNYWIVNGLFNFASYALTAVVFVVYGRYVCRLDFFEQTNMRVLIEVYFLWGLSQISLPMFFSTFFSSAQSAAMTSYAITIWTCCLTADLNVAVFTYPRRLPEWMMHYPACPYVRVMYLLLDPCTWESCYGDYDIMPAEVFEMQWYMLRNAILYFFMALYFNEVVPQTYGVPKHPLFFCEG